MATSGAPRHSLGWPATLYPPSPSLHVQTQGNPWSEYKCCDRTSNSVTAKTENPGRAILYVASHEREMVSGTGPAKEQYLVSGPAKEQYLVSGPAKEQYLVSGPAKEQYGTWCSC